MKESKGLMETNLSGLQLAGRGKVRDIYDLGNHLLIVTTDRISAFDVVMQDPIPGKGRILTGMSVFWFKKTEDLVQNHLVSVDPADFPASCAPHREVLDGRSMMVKKARPLPVECIVRGYLSGSGWQEYRKSRSICSIPLPEGLTESSRLPEPLFTPTTKAEIGQHDMPMTRKEMENTIGTDLTERVIELSIAVYRRAADRALKAGIIIADTKMEFGLLDGELILIDELLTPDSSRFWPADSYEEGRSQMSFDKQFLRDYLLSLNWNQKPPAPVLPVDIVQKTLSRYEEALQRLTG
ncbi:MAG: phosphoribosylaminoimidazolesuccinocarboxamide synthase [Syntrophaceae bacterium]|nr:phosphoribosylaminoimidazolesuccinocarboxamide synthase [Syntrophaceae bacterium]